MTRTLWRPAGLLRKIGLAGLILVLGFAVAGCGDAEVGPTGGAGKPNAPTGAMAMAMPNNTIIVSWNEVSGATSYRVYRSTSASGTYILAGETIDTSYPDYDLNAKTTYYFKVTAVNSVGESAQSSYTSATTLDSVGGQLSAPTGVTAIAMPMPYNTIIVSWNAVSGATSYRVYRSTSASGTYILAGETIDTSYRDYDLSAKTTYYFKVTAVNYLDESAQSSSTFATTSDSAGGQLSAPTGVTATAASSSSITVSWNEVSGATSYKVYRSTSASGTYTSDGETTTTPYTSTGLNASTTYYFKVTAVNSDGESVQSSSTSVTTLASVLNAPTGVTAIALSSDSISVSWNAVSGATSYRIYRSTSDSGTYTFDGQATTTSYTSTGLNASTTYYFKVTAVNSGGESEQSASISATTSAITYTITVSSGITGGTVTANPATSAASGTTITLSNTPATGYIFSHYTVNGTRIDGNTFTLDTNATVSAVFNQPNAEIPIGNPSVKLYLNGGTSSLTEGGTTTINNTTTSYTVGVVGGTYSSIIWYLNGSVLAEGVTSITLSRSKQNSSGGVYLVTVEATLSGTKDTGSHKFVLQQ